MFLVVNASGKYWDGNGWSERGITFCTPARAVRSLHENGEDLEVDVVLFTESNIDNTPALVS